MMSLQEIYMQEKEEELKTKIAKELKTKFAHEIAMKMFRNNKDEEEIKELTELSSEELTKIKAELKTNKHKQNNYPNAKRSYFAYV